MQRAVAASALARGKSAISNPSLCEDAKAAIRCARALGARVEIKNGKAIVEGRAGRVGRKLDCGESGLCMRMFAPIAALSGKQVEITGKGSLLSRPAGMVAEPLRKLGAECRTTRGRLPIIVRGPIRADSLEVDGSESSQFVTGLLMALPLCEGDSVLKVSNLKSKPYVLMTLELLAKFGIKVRHDRALSRFEIMGGQKYRPRSMEVEGDWSSAAFLLVAGAVAGRVRVNGLRADSLQADRAVIAALRGAGAKVRIGKCEAVAEKSGLNGFRFDASDCPDLFPPLAALACSCKGTTVLSGVGRLKGKESDRAASLVSELSAMGARVKVDGNRMIITGGKLLGGEVDSHNDHRIAMACAVAALASEKGAKIAGEKCVAKSYPGFFRDLDSLGVS